MERGTEEERYYKERHLVENTFEDSSVGGAGGAWASSSGVEDSGDGGRESFIEGEEVRVVVVRIRDGRVSDWKGGVRDFSMESGVSDEGVVERRGVGGGLVNGIS